MTNPTQTTREAAAREAEAAPCRGGETCACGEGCACGDACKCGGGSPC